MSKNQPKPNVNSYAQSENLFPEERLANAELKTLVELSDVAGLNIYRSETTGNDTTNDEEEQSSCEIH